MEEMNKKNVKYPYPMKVERVNKDKIFQLLGMKETMMKL
jgi:hypothetical protein